MQEDVTKAIQILKDGGIVIFPTDTAFGIGCRIDDEQAIRRLFTIRKRPETQATPVLVSGIEMAQEYLAPISDEIKEKLLTPYWPGAVTVVLQSRIEKIPELVRGGTSTLGVRMPNHPSALQIIREVGVPILGPSANFHGEPTPYTFEELDKELLSLVDYVVPGPARNATHSVAGGECSVKQASTVVDCTVEPWKVLRQGAVDLKI